MACANGMQPLQLPIRNVTFEGGSNVRGIELGVGTPQQIISALPSVQDLDLPLLSSRSCSTFNGTREQCIAASGGVYDPAGSSTGEQVRLSEWNGAWDDGWFAGSWLFYNERVAFGAEGAIDSLPLFMRTSQPQPSRQCVLPLGPNSTFLTTAYRDGQIPSTVIGLYAGSISVEAPDDGLVVVGGYDSAGYEGDLVDLPYEPGCPACFQVESIAYNGNGAATELLNGTIRAIFHPADDVLTLPVASYERLAQAAQSSAVENNGESANMRIGELQGNLTITLANGFEVSIPSYELSYQPRNYSVNGNLQLVDNASARVMLEAADSDGAVDFIYIWGMPFLSQVFLVHDHDLQKSKIGKARRLDRRLTAEAGQSTRREIETICPPNPNTSTKGSPTAAIAGGVVGGVMFIVALIALGLWFRLRRQRRSRAMLFIPEPGNKAGEDVLTPKSTIGSVSTWTGGELAHSPSTVKSTNEGTEKQAELSHSPSTTKSRVELPEKHLVEMPTEETWRWKSPVELETQTAFGREKQAHGDDGRDGLHELYLPTPKRTNFPRWS